MIKKYLILYYMDTDNGSIISHEPYHTSSDPYLDLEEIKKNLVLDPIICIIPEKEFIDYVNKKFIK